MEEKIQKEFKELQNLEAEGGLDETQTARLSFLKAFEQAEKTAEEKSKELKSALAQKEHFRTKAEKAEADRAALEEKLKGNIEVKNLNPLEVVKLGKSLANYNEQETEYVIERAKGKFNTLEPTPAQIIEASKDEMTQLTITAMREKVKKDKTPPPSGKQDVTKGKTLKEMTLEEKNKFFSERGFVKEFPKAKPL